MSRHVLDEQIDLGLYHQLRQHISADKVGVDFGRIGWTDQEIVRELHGGGRTFHTQDDDYYYPRLCHPKYCLVYYDVPNEELANYILRFLHHPAFNSHAKRLGKVIKVTAKYVEYHSWGVQQEQRVEW